MVLLDLRSSEAFSNSTTELCDDESKILIKNISSAYDD